MSVVGKTFFVRRRRHRWLLLLALLCTALLVSQSPFLELFNRRLQANINRTRLGMTREQVETILGEPQGGSATYTTATWEDAYCIVRLRFDNEGHLCRVWGGGETAETPEEFAEAITPALRVVNPHLRANVQHGLLVHCGKRG